MRFTAGFRRDHRLTRLLELAVDVYGAGALIFLFLRVLTGEQIGLIALANLFLPYIVGACLLLIPVRLILRRHVAVLWNVIPAIPLLFHYVPDFLPKPIPAPILETTTISVYSHNVAGAIGYYDSVIDGMARSDADVLIIQDVGEIAAQVLRERFEPAYPHVVYTPGESRGKLTFSRYPFIEAPDGSFADGFHRVLISVDDRSLAIYNVHLRSPRATPTDPDFDTRQRQLDELIDSARSLNMPIIIAGDFNLNDWSTPYAQIAALYQDAHRQRGWGLGFTRDADEIPLSRIDFIFHNTMVQTLDFETSALSLGSDHRAIFARLAVQFPAN